jgi:hypothetical protein
VLITPVVSRKTRRMYFHFLKGGTTAGFQGCAAQFKDGPSRDYVKLLSPRLYDSKRDPAFVPKGIRRIHQVLRVGPQLPHEKGGAPRFADPSGLDRIIRNRRHVFTNHSG